MQPTDNEGRYWGYPPRLVPARGVAAKLLYALARVPGAMQHPFLAEELLPLLADVRRRLIRSGYDVLLWDGYRTRRTQQAIFDSYKTTLRASQPEMCEDELQQMTLRFVSDPSGIFPHGTGGAIDLTLIRDGKECDMGTGFDDFTPRAAPDYFSRHPPKSAADHAVAYCRSVLTEAMLEAGFVGIDSEWWHFEAYTPNWAKAKGKIALLEAVIENPSPADPALRTRPLRRGWPELQSGVAMPFRTADARREALGGHADGYYYIRTSGPTASAAADAVAQALSAEGALLVESGVAAHSCAMRTMLPVGGTALVDRHIYYECKASLMAHAQLAGARVLVADVRDPESLAHALAGVDRVDVVAVDSPANWFLHVAPLVELRELARQRGAKLLVDSSVQPIQPALRELADLVVCSLSKWPTHGATAAGAVLGSAELVTQVGKTAAIDGHVLGPEAAFTVLRELPGLEDRLRAASAKARLIKATLEHHPLVKAIRLPDGEAISGLCGGQLVVELHDAAVGDELEQLVGQNVASDILLVPHLACTFGSALSTIEHFASNRRHRTGLAADRKATGEAEIPDTFVRISVGEEKGRDLAHGLLLLLNLLLKPEAHVAYAPVHSETT